MVTKRGLPLGVALFLFVKDAMVRVKAGARK